MAVNKPEQRATAEDARIAQLYRQASVDEPPARVDAAIRSTARAGSTVRVRPHRSAWWMPWRVPFAVAAVALVSASLVTLVMDEGGKRIAEIAVPPAPQQGGARSPAAELEPRGEVPADRAIAREQRRSQSPELRATPPAALPTLPSSDDTALSKAEGEQAPTQEAPARGFGVPMPPKEAGSLGTHEPKIAVAPARERAAIQAAPAPAAAAARRADRAEAALEAPPDITPFTTELEREPPARWIERITGLMREDRRREAEALLAEFKRRYPQERLPPSLE